MAKLFTITLVLMAIFAVAICMDVKKPAAPRREASYGYHNNDDNRKGYNNHDDEEENKGQDDGRKGYNKGQDEDRKGHDDRKGYNNVHEDNTDEDRKGYNNHDDEEETKGHDEDRKGYNNGHDEDRKGYNKSNGSDDEEDNKGHDDRKGYNKGHDDNRKGSNKGYNGDEDEERHDWSIKSARAYKFCSYPNDDCSGDASCFYTKNGQCWTFPDGSSGLASVVGDDVNFFLFENPTCQPGVSQNQLNQPLKSCFASAVAGVSYQIAPLQ